MELKINLTATQEKFLKKIYGDTTPEVLIQIWFEEWLNKRVDKMYIPKKTLNDKITEITKLN